MSARDWPLLVRRATAADKEAVLEFASTTWDGWDYIPNAWDAWLTADDGVLLVGCAGEPGGRQLRDADGGSLEAGRPVAVARVALLSPREAWLEGIRVDPRVRGLGVATDFQTAELHWAAASGATVVRYATGQRNEASHRLGARHGFEVIARLSSWQWHARPPRDGDADDDSESAFDEETRAAASRHRQALLAELRAADMAAQPADGDAWWQLVNDDPSFDAAQRLVEHRAWTVQELTRTLFDAHLARGEVLVDGGPGGGEWALAVLEADVMAAEDADLHLSLLCGHPEAALRLADEVRRRASQKLRFRLAHDAPIGAGRQPELAAAGFYPRPYQLHILARRLDAGHPAPAAEPGSLVLGDVPAPLSATVPR